MKILGIVSMKKSFILTLALVVFIVTGCRNKDSTSPVEIESQDSTAQIQDSSVDQEVEQGDVETDPDSLSTQTMEDATRQAQVLTEHLVNRAFHKGIVERGEAVGDSDIFSFFTTLPGYMDNEDHPYYDAVTVTPEYLYIFPKEKVEQIPYELFGVEGWSFGDSMEYNSTAEQYESGLEFGTGWNSYLCSELQAVYLNDTGVIEVSFQLAGSAVVDDNPGWEDLGEYVARYHVMQESSLFLRYEGIRKA